MIKRGWIEADRDKISRLQALLTFLEVAIPEPLAIQEAVGFRITEAAQKKVSAGSLAAWLRKGEREARERSTADYDPDTFRAALGDIRQMTEDPPHKFVPAMTDPCAQAGVALCLCPTLLILASSHRRDGEFSPTLPIRKRSPKPAWKCAWLPESPHAPAHGPSPRFRG